MNHNTDGLKTPRSPIRCAVYFAGHINSGPFAGPFGRVIGLKFNFFSKEIECWYGFRKIQLSDVTPEEGTDFSVDRTTSAEDVVRFMEAIHTLCGVSLGTYGLCTFDYTFTSII